MVAVVRPIRVRVHEGSDGRVDAILRLTQLAARARPLAELLGAMCAHVAEIARVDVVSAYVLEPGDEGEVLVLRANVGFPASAIGNVRLRPGEGITGFVAECLKPVSVAIARTEEHYKHVPGLGEEQFPSYLGLPILTGSGCAGVLVLQKRETSGFAAADVALAAALAAPFAFALERSKSRREAGRVEGSAPERSARLAGTPRSPGRALGTVQLLSGEPNGKPLSPNGSEAVSLALASLGRELVRARKRIDPRLEHEARVRLGILCLVLEDERFRELAMAEAATAGVAAGMRRVAREYARASWRVAEPGCDADAWLAERSLEIEDLCLLIAARAAGERLPRSGAVVVTERLSAFVALAAAANRAAAVILGGPAEDGSLGVAIARAAGLPVVAEVAGLFVWTRAADRVLVDGTSGAVRVNPPATAIARFRRQV